MNDVTTEVKNQKLTYDGDDIIVNIPVHVQNHPMSLIDTEWANNFKRNLDTNIKVDFSYELSKTSFSSLVILQPEDEYFYIIMRFKINNHDGIEEFIKRIKNKVKESTGYYNHLLKQQEAKSNAAKQQANSTVEEKKQFLDELQKRIDK